MSLVTGRFYPRKQGVHGMVWVSELPVWRVPELATQQAPEVNKESQTVIERNQRTGFCGGRTIQSSAAFVKAGWPEGGKRIKQLCANLADLLPTPKDRKRRIRWADDGDTLDPDRALAGQWDVAYRKASRRFMTGSTVINLYCAWGGNAHLSQEQLFWPGATAIALSDALENAGYATRVVMLEPTSCTSYGSKTGLASIQMVLKEAGEALRYDILAAAACDVGVYRNLGFLWSILNELPYEGGLGAVVSLATAKPILQACHEWPEGEDVIVVPHAYDEEAAVKEIIAAVNQIDGEMTRREDEALHPDPYAQPF